MCICICIYIYIYVCVYITTMEINTADATVLMLAHESQEICQMPQRLRWPGIVLPRRVEHRHHRSH